MSIKSTDNHISLYKKINDIIPCSLNKIHPLNNSYINMILVLSFLLFPGSIYYFYFENNLMHATAFLSILIAFGAMSHLADLIPKTFGYIWTNGLIISNYLSKEQNEDNIDNYIEFINDLTSKIHSKWQYLYIMIFGSIGYWIWSFDFRLMKAD